MEEYDLFKFDLFAFFQKSQHYNPYRQTKMKSLRVEFDIPTLLAHQVGLNEENVSLQVRRIVALFLFEHKRISLGKACEIGGLNYWEFAELNQQMGIPFNYSPADLNDDLTRLADV